MGYSSRNEPLLEVFRGCLESVYYGLGANEATVKCSVVCVESPPCLTLAGNWEAADINVEKWGGSDGSLRGVCWHCLLVYLPRTFWKANVDTISKALAISRKKPLLTVFMPTLRDVFDESEDPIICREKKVDWWSGRKQNFGDLKTMTTSAIFHRLGKCLTKRMALRMTAVIPCLGSSLIALFKMLSRPRAFFFLALLWLKKFLGIRLIELRLSFGWGERGELNKMLGLN